MAVSGASSLSQAVRFKASDATNGAPPPRHPSPSVPILSVPKPSWIVRTEANVRIERRKKPDPPCVVCSGSGRVDCAHCNGTGRTNYVHLTMLPTGEWPKWCRTCGGSGLDYCTRCIGTGEYRYIMGFSFMKRDSDGTQNQQKLEEACRNLGPQTAADKLLNNEESSSSDLPGHQGF
ncbi:hypothetical protein NMG60_11029290 [Bertholletia excelsa]